MKKSFLMMCPLLFSCLSAPTVSAEPCDYVVTDANLQQVAFFDNKPVALCFSTVVDRYVTGAYQGWNVSLEKGRVAETAPQVPTEQAPVIETAPQQKTAAEETAPAPAADIEESAMAAEDQLTADPSVQADTEPADTTAHGETPAAEVAEAAAAAEVSEEPHQAPDEHAAGKPVESHAAGETTEAAGHAEEHAPQATATDKTPADAVPFQKMAAPQAKHTAEAVAPHKGWVETDRHDTPAAADAHLEQPDDSHGEQAAAAHTEEETVAHGEAIGQPDELAAHPLPVEASAEAAEQPLAEEIAEQVADHTEPEVVEQAEEKQVPEVVEVETATGAGETDASGQEQPPAEESYPFIDKLLVAPNDKQSRDTVLFAYVEGKPVPIIIQLKNNME